MAAAAGGELWRERQRAADIARVLALYRPLLDAYVVEFFAEDLWAQLPPSWQAALAAAPAPQLAARLLEPPGTSAGTGAGTGAAAVWPLSLLAFRATAQALAFPRHRHRPRRQRSGPAEFRHNRSQSAALHPLLRKHVKPKKQHEIRRLGKVVKRLSEAAGCDRVVDVGSGQGHLSRVLAFGLGLPVSAVEADGRLVQAAERFDRELLRALRKAHARGDEVPLSPRPPEHVAGRLDPRAPWPAVRAMLRQHPKVVAFFSLALLLAPLVESLILLDRLLFLRERGFQCALVPLFDPLLSPRNLVLVAAKCPLGPVLAALEDDSSEDEDEDGGGDEAAVQG
ncbi:protein RRNAD1 [Nothoprocta perdicaria]|uniref:protein RRNAD1 n=1 Tax=Nothoprocta perdicaria TaxID=30464 RepID=UPI000E1BEB35|nr:protein RRNAD1 [Nothoprocta perdicaria]